MKHFPEKSADFPMQWMRKDPLGHFRLKRSRSGFRLFVHYLTLLTAIGLIWLPRAGAGDFERDIRALSALGDRSTGTSGCRSAAGYIRHEFQEAGFSEVGVHRYSLPILQQGKSQLAVPDRGMTLSLHPLPGNAISPQAIDPQGLNGPLIYTGTGD
jgi:hypothetical protein